MIRNQVAPFDDRTWTARISDYRQRLTRQQPQREAPLTIVHSPYPYQRMIYTTKQKSAPKPMLQRLDLPRQAPVAPEIGVYWGIHQIVNVTRVLRQKAAAMWAHKWLDPFTYFDEDETPYNKAGGIDMDKAIVMAWGVLRSIQHVETESLINLYEAALRANEKVVYLAPEVKAIVLPTNIIAIPLVELSRHPRTCTVCGTKTSSGVRALCDPCHRRYIVDANFKHSAISYDELARSIIQADNNHRLKVLETRKLKAA